MMSRRSRSQEDPPADAAATHHPRSKPEMDKVGFSTTADSQHRPDLRTYQDSCGDEADVVVNHLITLARFPDVQHLPELSTDQGNDGGSNADLVGTACSTPHRQDLAPQSTHLFLHTERPERGGGLASAGCRKHTW